MLITLSWLGLRASGRVYSGPVVGFTGLVYRRTYANVAGS